MKRTILEIGCVGLMVVLALNLIACSPVREVRAVEQQVVGATGTASTGVAAPPVVTNALGPSCANPTPEMAPGCEMVAQRILASTVRLELTAAGRDGGGNELLNGHGTIRDGRYVVTHNH